MNNKKISLVIVILIGILFFTIVQAEEYIITVKEDKIVAESFSAKSFSARSLSAQSQTDFKDEINITHSFTTFEGYVADLTPEKVKELQKNPNLIIEKSRIFYSLLDDSIPQVNANDSWNLLQNSTNLTGISQTVCVIDTGVNYSHPNLGGCYGNNNASSNCTVIGGWDYFNDDDDPIDDAGHGTHVTGIIVSNHSTYSGVSPGVKIVSLKALGSDGTGSTTKIVNSIEWCTNNATAFNISVITMSLGTNGVFENSYCNSLSTSLTNAIHAATAANITVIASAGNCENSSGDITSALCKTGITLPACIEGVIPVGTVNDADAISNQRGSLFEVLAPGVSIISTAIGGGTTPLSGTSMSAPHVAGLAAVLSQFYKLQSNKTFTNLTLIDALNNTETFINDSSGTELLFPRIDFLRSLYFLDNVVPNVTLISPTNATINSSINQTFVANLTDFTLQNLTFYLWNDLSIENQTSQNVSGQSTQFEINITNLSQSETTTTINSPTNDSATNTSTTNFSCSVNASVYTWYIIAQDKNENTFTSLNNTLILNNTGTNLTNMTFKIYNSTALLFNTTTQVSGNSNLTIFNYTFSIETNYTWNCSTSDNNSESFNTQSYKITYDATSPQLNLTSDLPTSVTSNSVSKTFYYNVSDNNVNASCSLLFSNVSQESKTITNYSETQNFTRTVTPATYIWSVNCSDQAGNSNLSSENTFTITAVSTSPGGGGSSSSGGGSASTTIGTVNNPVTASELSSGSGYKAKFSKGKQVYFTTSKKENHSIKLNDIINNKISITINSEPINITLDENSTIKINITSPETLDLQITTGSITGAFVNITIKEINEINPYYTKKSVNESERIFHTLNETNGSLKEKNKKEIEYIIIGILILLVIYILKVTLYDKYTKKHISVLNVKGAVKKNKKSK